MRLLKILTIVAVIVVALAAVVGGGIFWYLRRTQLASADPTSVRLEPLTRGDLVEVISAPGVVQAKTKVSISAKVSARILELPHKEGEKVKAGDLLVRLDAKDLDAALRSAQARYEAQEAQIKVEKARIESQKAQIESQRVSLLDARRDLQRQKDLFETKDVSQSVVETAQVKVDSLVKQIDAAEKGLLAEEASIEVLSHNLAAAAADVQKAKEDLSYAMITSPIDGTVTRLNAEVGEMVVTGTMNNAGTVILEVADLSQMMVLARVDESSVANVKEGQHAIVRLQAYRDKTFDGTVTAVALANTDDKDGTKYYKTEILLKPTAERILTGLTADVDIETRRSSNVLKVPSQAVMGRSVDELPSELRLSPEVEKGKTSVPVVFRCVDGKAVITPVSIGSSDLTSTIIKSGAKEGDLVVTGPYKVLEAIKNGQLIKSDRPATQPSIAPASRPATLPASVPATGPNGGS